jgi:type II restriction enzyme
LLRGLAPPLAGYVAQLANLGLVDEDLEAQRAALSKALAPLSSAQLEVLAGIVEGLSAELQVYADPASDFTSEAFALTFGDLLLIHHALSRESFSKDKFEHGLETALRRVGIPATLAARGNPGHDITVHDERWSLKTQAARDIKPDRIDISKFMELGKGQWIIEADLAGLRDRMFAHMQGYDRILMLRTPSAAKAAARDPFHYYELVEIPKALLLRAASVDCVTHQKSKQTPKIGSCTVTENGEVLFQLYFDGGTERKLQVKRLAKSACHVHATWRFPRAAPPA